MNHPQRTTPDHGHSTPGQALQTQLKLHLQPGPESNYLRECGTLCAMPHVGTQWLQWRSSAAAGPIHPLNEPPHSPAARQCNPHLAAAIGDAVEEKCDIPQSLVSAYKRPPTPHPSSVTATLVVVRNKQSFRDRFFPQPTRDCICSLAQFISTVLPPFCGQQLA